MRKLAFLLIMSGVNLTCYGMQAADKLIPNLAETLQKQKAQTSLPVIFPKVLPPSAEIKRFYLHLDSSDEQYTLSVDATADCNGARVCSMGYINARQLANPEIYYDMDNREITTSVHLAKGLKGYFTPGHAMGSFFPATLSWRQGSVLYTVSWSLNKDDEKTSLVQLANSAIASQP